MNEDGSRPLSGYVLLFTAVLPLLYILSIGPAAAIANHYHLHSEGLQTVYFPLMWLCDHVPTVDRALEWYTRLWDERWT